MINFNEQYENDLIEELNESHNLDIEEEKEEIIIYDNKSTTLYDFLFNLTICSNYQNFEKNSKHKNVYEINVSRLGDLLLGAELEINKSDLLEDDFYEKILNTIITVEIGGRNIMSLHMFTNIYLAKIINLNIKNTENMIIIPLFCLYYLAMNCDSEIKGFSLINLQFHSFKIKIESTINLHKYGKLNIIYKNLPLELRRYTSQKNIHFLNIKSLLYNTIDYDETNMKIPACLFIKCVNDINNITVIIDGVEYEYNILKGDVEELYILEHRYIILNLDNVNIKYIIKNPKKAAFRVASNFKINFYSINDIVNNIHLLYAYKHIISGGTMT